MLISSKGRYALRVMLDLAEHDSGGYVVLMDVAARQGISEKYLESILAGLSREGFVLALRGRGGGYRLSRQPEDYTVGSILRTADGSLAPVSCLDGPDNPCPNADHCRTLPVWKGLDKVMDDYLEGVTLRDLMQQAV